MPNRLRSIATEFVIVVVGVLVALAADSWMDGVRQSDARTAALAALRRDIAEDLAQLDTLRLPFLDAREEGRRFLLTVAADDRPLEDSVRIVQAIVTLGSYQTFDANTTAIDYLTSTGALQLIDDPDLLSSILTYYNSVEDVSELDALYRADAIASASARAGLLVRGEASAAALDLRWRRATHEDLRAASATALDARVLRGEEGLPRFLNERHPSLVAQAASYPRLRREADRALESLDRELTGR